MFSKQFLITGTDADSFRDFIITSTVLDLPGIIKITGTGCCLQCQWSVLVFSHRVPWVCNQNKKLTNQTKKKKQRLKHSNKDKEQKN